jgi:hypothetical protein
MPFVDRYWVPDPRDFEDRSTEILSLYPSVITSFELCKAASGDLVSGFRLGRGKRRGFLLGRVHGHEPSGTCGLTALMEGLASGKSPDTGEQFEEAQVILDEWTLDLFPMVNPSAAGRYSSQIEDSYIGEKASSAKEEGRFEEWLRKEYEPVLHEPGLILKKRRPAYFTSEDLRVMETLGRPMGSLFTIDGVELWKDWVNQRAVQTRALKNRMTEHRLDLLVDVHNDSPPTRICPPTEAREDALYQRLGGAVYRGLGRAGIDSSQKVEPYLKNDENKSVSWAHETLGTIQFLYEINGIGSKAHMIQAVWHGITELLLEVCRPASAEDPGRKERRAG